MKNGASVNPNIKEKFDSYPELAKKQLLMLRGLIFRMAEGDGLGQVEESVKWGEASYLVKGGSAIRIDWKPKDPDVIKVYFHCQTRLVETFKEIYPVDFNYEGNRALVIALDAEVEAGPLAHCVRLALNYHRIKHLPLLGV